MKLHEIKLEARFCANVISGYGLKDGYVAFAIEHVKIVKVGVEQ